MVLNEESPANFSRIYETYHDRVLAYVAKLIGRAEATDMPHRATLPAAHPCGQEYRHVVAP